MHVACVYASMCVHVRVPMHVCMSDTIKWDDTKDDP